MEDANMSVGGMGGGAAYEIARIAVHDDYIIGFRVEMVQVCVNALGAQKGVHLMKPLTCRGMIGAMVC